ncbi:MAG: hypothetical protein U1F43_34305 [Myxococcota bacterium]
MSRLALGEVLATGAVPRDDDAKSALVGLARSFDAAAKPGTTSAIALWGALAARLDEPLLAADVLAHARSAATADPLVEPAYLEVARRATRQIRVSAGALATSTQRDMLVAGLRFFRHLDAVLGPSSDRAAELMDQAGASPAAARELAQLLAANEGSAASQKSALGPATCELACDAAARLCPNEVDRPTCQVRCARTGVVRFVDRARPLASEARETWFCGQ